MKDKLSRPSISFEASANDLEKDFEVGDWHTGLILALEGL